MEPVGGARWPKFKTEGSPKFGMQDRCWNLQHEFVRDGGTGAAGEEGMGWEGELEVPLWT